MLPRAKEIVEAAGLKMPRTMLPRAKEIVDAAGVKMQDAVDFLEEDLKNYRVGKATPAIFNGVTVDYYGTATPLNQVASITTPDAKTIAIQPWERNMISKIEKEPWERNMISKIEKAILDANVGLTPSNNGEIIRCVVPALTEERRRELIKKAKAQGETTKVTVRNARRDGIDLLKKAQKNEGLSEDGEKEGEEELQKVTDKYVKAVDAVIAEKEKEILTV